MLDAIVLLGAGLFAFMWALRGGFSSFLHMLCVIVSGAMAFALWEPIAIAILGSQGFGSDFAFAAGLALPFVITLIITRVLCDKLASANLDLDSTSNMVIGGLCGAVSGTLTVGIAVLALSYSRLDTSLFGWRPIEFDGSGALVRKSTLIFPAERLTVAAYSMLSEGTFRPLGGETLHRWHPDLADEGALLRTNFEEGKSRHLAAPGTFEIGGRYTLTPKNPGELLNDTLGNKKQSQYLYVSGATAELGESVIEGYVIKFKAGAKEKSGRVVVGSGQVRLIVQTDANDPGSTKAIHPVAMISQADGSKTVLGRWAFDSRDVFISSVGGRDDAPMAFEFVVPKGSLPLALYVKGVRQDISAIEASAKYDSIAARDAAIGSGAIVLGGAVGTLDRDSAIQVKLSPNEDRIRTGNNIPFGIVLTRDTAKGLTLGEKNAINGGGLSKFVKSDLEGNQGVDPALAVRTLFSSDDTVLVHVVVDRKNTEFGFLSQAANNADLKKAPLLIDNNNAPYSPVGFVYRDSAQTWIYFDPQAPVQSVVDGVLPSISKSKPDQELVLIYRVSRNVKILSFAIGEKIIADFKPPVDTGTR